MIVKSPVGMPGRAILNPFMKRVIAGEKISHRCHGCLHGCQPQQIPYIVIVKSPVGMPGRAILNPFMKRVIAGEKISHRCHGCLHGCQPQQIPYCITDALIHAVKGETDEGLLFCGAKAWKAIRIETVKEVIESFF